MNDQCKIDKVNLNNRMKKVKSIEKQFSKDLASVCKTKKKNQIEEKKKDEILEKYNSMLSEIEFIETQKKKIIIEKENNEIQSKLLIESNKNRLNDIERKKKKFDEFMKEKQINALEKLQNDKEKQEWLKEDKTKIKLKSKIKEEEFQKSKELTKKYKQTAALKSEAEEKAFNDDNNIARILYTNKQNYYPYGNSIDYTNSRFHSISVVRHDDELVPKLNANEKAIIEIEKSKTRIKSKEKSIEKFQKEINLMSFEEQKKLKAKDNLQKLEENLKIMRIKKVVNKTKNINNNAVNNKNNKEKENNGEIGRDIPIEERMKLISAFCEENFTIEKEDRQYFEEPVTRETNTKEFIERLNPVDFDCYIDKGLIHKEIITSEINPLLDCDNKLNFEVNETELEKNREKLKLRLQSNTKKSSNDNQLLDLLKKQPTNSKVKENKNEFVNEFMSIFTKPKEEIHSNSIEILKSNEANKPFSKSNVQTQEMIPKQQKIVQSKEQLENKEEEEQIPKNPLSKQKYSKEELLSRRKQMLKDKKY